MKLALIFKEKLLHFFSLRIYWLKETFPVAFAYQRYRMVPAWSYHAEDPLTINLKPYKEKNIKGMDSVSSYRSMNEQLLFE